MLAPLRLAALGTSLVALGGCSEFQLAPSQGPDETEVPAATDEAQGSGDESPWDAPDPGSRPEDVFFAAWWDVTDPHNVTGEVPHRFDVIDVEGQVVVAFTPPSPDMDDPLAIHPAGPGRVLVTTGPARWTTTPSATSSWIADAATGKVTEVLRVGWDGLLYAVVDGTAHRLERLYDRRFVHVVPDPQDPDRLFVVGRVATGAGVPDVGPLLEIDLRDPLADPIEHAPSALFDPALVRPPEGGSVAPWPGWVEAVVVEGRTELRLLLESLEEIPEDGDGLAEPRVLRRLTRFSPDDGAWLPGALEVTDVVYGPELRFRPDDGSGGTVLVHHDIDRVGGQNFLTWDGREAHEWTGADERAWDVRLGPLLDPDAPTFAHFGYVPHTVGRGSPNTLSFSHRGVDVLTLEVFRVGLGERRFRLLALELVPPLP